MLKISNIKDLEHEELKSEVSGEKFSLAAVLSSIYDFKDLFIHHEILLPGRKASAAHSIATQFEGTKDQSTYDIKDHKVL